jgi:hypothetical protein
VATPDLPSLEAVLITGGRRISARLLNLTETGMGLGLRDPTPLAIHSAVVVETHLPGGTPFKTSGEVRHSEVLADDPLPGRVGLVLGDIGPECREALRRFVQARRMDRSATLRKAIPSRNGRK